MRKNNFKEVSVNTTQFLVLHDCQCSKMIYKSNQLQLKMDWIEVLSQHPLNPNKESYQTDEAEIYFDSPVILECELIQKDGSCIQVNDCMQLDFSELEFLEYEEQPNSQKAKMFFLFQNKHSAFESCILEIKFLKSIVMWNRLIEPSWFEKIKNEK